LTLNVRYFFDKQAFADTQIDCRCAPTAVDRSIQRGPHEGDWE
jgi:hypothetical protein